MTTSKKVSLSLLITVLLFGIFLVLAFTGLFNRIEARFFNPSVSAAINRDVRRSAEIIDKLLADANTRFAETLRHPAIRRTLMPYSSDDDIFARCQVYGLLGKSLAGFQWVRFVDPAGVRLYYSSHEPDILGYDLEASFKEHILGNGGETQTFFDEKANRVLFTFPLYDAIEAYRGAAIFSFSARAISNRLISEGYMKAGESLQIISNPHGFLIAENADAEKMPASQVSFIWRERRMVLTRLETQYPGLPQVLISTISSHGLFVGRLVNEELFQFSETLKLVLLVSFFLTVFLTVFLFFNFKQDPVTIIQNRLKQLQISLIEQFYEQKDELNLFRWKKELEHRRDEILVLLKRGIKAASDNQAKEITSFIDKSWDEFFSIIESYEDTDINEEKLKAILADIMGSPSGWEPRPCQSLALSSEAAAPVQRSVRSVSVKDGSSLTGSASLLKKADALKKTDVTKPDVRKSEIKTTEVKADAPIEGSGKQEKPKKLDGLEQLEKLEKLEKYDELEELVSFEDEEIAEEEPSAPSGAILSREEIERLAREIEFSSDVIPESELDEDNSIERDLEIVSPFADLNFVFADSEKGTIRDTFGTLLDEEVIPLIDREDGKSKEVSPEEFHELAPENAMPGKIPLIHKPFDGITGSSRIGNVEAISDEEESAAAGKIVKTESKDIIKERGGVPYINGDVLSPRPKTKTKINNDFKKLVDSVIKD